MKIIISPAKTMKMNPSIFENKSKPAHRKKTESLLKALQNLNTKQLKTMYKASDKITQENFDRFKNMDLDKDLTAAIYAYQGQVYQHIGAEDMSKKELDYLNQHLRIISAFYGLVKPFDGIVPYRLEMANKLQVDDKKNLYDFWGNRLYKDLFADGDMVINLASKEYFSVITKYLQAKDNFIDVEFVKVEDGETKQLGMKSKTARGEMIRFLAEYQIQELEDMKNFTYDTLRYSKKYSKENKLVFIES